MSGFEYAGLGLVIAAIPIALASLAIRKVTRAGAAALAIAVYMLAVGVMFVGEGAWSCRGLEEVTIISPGGTGPFDYQIQKCSSYGAEPVYLGFGVGMLASASTLFAALTLIRSAARRRIVIAASTLLSISALGYAYTPSGLIIATFSVLFLGVAVARNWELRRPRG